MNGDSLPQRVALPEVALIHCPVPHQDDRAGGDNGAEMRGGRLGGVRSRRRWGIRTNEQRLHAQLVHYSLVLHSTRLPANAVAHSSCSAVAGGRLVVSRGSETRLGGACATASLVPGLKSYTSCTLCAVSPVL